MTNRAAKLRNILVSAVNGGITLIILLIAPLGLAAVIVNTLLVMAATYGVSTVADRVITWLQPSSEAELLSEYNSHRGSISRQHHAVRPWRRQ